MPLIFVQRRRGDSFTSCLQSSFHSAHQRRKFVDFSGRSKRGFGSFLSFQIFSPAQIPRSQWMTALGIMWMAPSKTTRRSFLKWCSQTVSLFMAMVLISFDSIAHVPRSGTSKKQRICPQRSIGMISLLLQEQFQSMFDALRIAAAVGSGLISKSDTKLLLL